MDFTGERFVPGTDGLLAAEHMQRYLFASRYAKGKTVLDIACGSGYGTRMLLDAGAGTATGVDVSAEATRYARARFADGTTDDKLRFVTADAETFRAGTFDLIVSFETLEHLEKRDQFLANIKGMLATAGMLVISTPNKAVTSPMKDPRKIRNQYHKYEYIEREFVDALQKAGFTGIQRYGQHLYPSIYQNQLISRLLRRWRKNATESPETAQVQELADDRIPRYFVFTAAV